MLTKNLKTKKKNNKLTYIRVKTFFIKDRIKNFSYKPKLSKNVKINLIFYILLLKLTNLETPVFDIFYY